ncbi:DUF6056 family protein [Ectobacillus funiculus]|uniref:DUF6056 family protein n=1 Tax=Ectobacillus funiculus TaxID=137993 RepID=UPI00397E4862
MLFNRNKMIGYVGLYVLLCAMHLIIIVAPGDDEFFAAVSHQYTLMEYVKTRYYGWSGRVFPEIMLYLLLDKYIWLWRMINSAFFILLAFAVVRIIKKDVRFFEIVVALATFGYFSQNLLSSGFFWITGSINYLWPFALGLVGMIPYADSIFRNESMDAKAFVICFLMGVIASISNEQVALCMICFSILTHLSLLVRKQKQQKRLFILTAVIITGACTLLFAPGNQVRWALETERWFPGFDKLSLKDHIYIGVIWFFDKVFNELRLLVMLVSITTLLMCYKDAIMKRKWYVRALFLLTTFIIGMQLLGYGLDFIDNFNMIRDYSISGTIFDLASMNQGFLAAILPYVWWTLYSVLLVYVVIVQSENKLFITLCLLAAIAAICVIFFSPTIYASGNRVLGVSAVLLSLVTVYTILRKNIIHNVFQLIIYSCIPFINIAGLFLTWIQKGFHVFM